MTAKSNGESPVKDKKKAHSKNDEMYVKDLQHIIKNHEEKIASMKDKCKDYDHMKHKYITSEKALSKMKHENHKLTNDVELHVMQMRVKETEIQVLSDSFQKKMGEKTASIEQVRTELNDFHERKLQDAAKLLYAGRVMKNFAESQFKKRLFALRCKCSIANFRKRRAAQSAEEKIQVAVHEVEQDWKKRYGQLQTESLEDKGEIIALKATLTNLHLDLVEEKQRNIELDHSKDKLMAAKLRQSYLKREYVKLLTGVCLRIYARRFIQKKRLTQTYEVLCELTTRLLSDPSSIKIRKEMFITDDKLVNRVHRLCNTPPFKTPRGQPRGSLEAMVSALENECALLRDTTHLLQDQRQSWEDTTHAFVVRNSELTTRYLGREHDMKDSKRRADEYERRCKDQEKENEVLLQRLTEFETAHKTVKEHEKDEQERERLRRNEGTRTLESMFDQTVQVRRSLIGMKEQIKVSGAQLDTLNSGKETLGKEIAALNSVKAKLLADTRIMKESLEHMYAQRADISREYAAPAVPKNRPRSDRSPFAKSRNPKVYAKPKRMRSQSANGTVSEEKLRQLRLHRAWADTPRGGYPRPPQEKKWGSQTARLPRTNNNNKQPDSSQDEPMFEHLERLNKRLQGGEVLPVLAAS